MRKIFRKLISPALLILLLAGCKKEFLETYPTDSVSGNTVFETTQGAFVALNGIYRRDFEFYGGSHGHFGQKAFDLTTELMGNDMVVHTQGYGWFNAEYQYTAISTSTSTSRSGLTWSFYYKLIDNANRIIANIDNSSGPQEERDNVKGQALAIRAYSYMNLINGWQHTYKGNESKPGVPLYTEPTSDGKGRGTVQEVYTQIVSDLDEAISLLNGIDRIHISHIDQNTAHGLRARVALQMEDFGAAATHANAARQGHTLMTATQYNAANAFSDMGANNEWIWGLEINTEQATIYASYYSHIDVATGGYAALGTQKKITKWLYDQIEDGDVRKDGFRPPGTGTSSYPDYNQNKLRVPSPGSWAADYGLMRAGEMYLIEAEALLRQSAANEDQARTVLESLVKVRYPAYDASGLTGQALLDEIWLQRRIELWGEGFALWDIKRLKQGLNRPTGPGNHGAPNFNPRLYTLPAEDAQFLFRIPQPELANNENMTDADQNP